MDINVGGSLSASAGGNLVAQGVNANVGGSTSLRAGKDMQLTTALRGHVNSFEFYNRYKSAGDLLKISQRINSRDIDLQNSGNGWNSGAGVNLSAGNNLSLVGAQKPDMTRKAEWGRLRSPANAWHQQPPAVQIGYCPLKNLSTQGGIP